MSTFTKREVEVVRNWIKPRSIYLVRLGLFLKHLEKNDYNRSATARTYGSTLNTVRALIRELRALGFDIPESSYGTNIRADGSKKERKKKEKKEKEEYKERVFVSYEQR